MASERPLPSHLARGITRKECVEGRNIRRCAFDFDRDDPSKPMRELSVEWLDDRNTVEGLRARRRPGHDDPQFILGFAVLSRSRLDAVRCIDRFNRLCYRRSPGASPSHGLILHPRDRGTNGRMLLKEISAELAANSVKYDFWEEMPIG